MAKKSIVFVFIFIFSLKISAQEIYNKLSIGVNYSSWLPVGIFSYKSLDDKRSGMASGAGFTPFNFNGSFGYYLNNFWETEFKLGTGKYGVNEDIVKLKYTGTPEDVKYHEPSGTFSIGSAASGPRHAWLITHSTLGINRYFFDRKIGMVLKIAAGPAFATFSSIKVDGGQSRPAPFPSLETEYEYSFVLQPKTSIAPYYEAGAGVVLQLNKVLSFNATVTGGYSQFNFNKAEVGLLNYNKEYDRKIISFTQEYYNVCLSGGIKIRFAPNKNEPTQAD